MVFHQFVLIKNDLFGAVPVALVLTWMISRYDSAGPQEVAWSAWLTAFALGVKLTSFPIFVLFTWFVLVRHRRLRHLGAAACGGGLGALAGGLIFTAVENTRLYGSPVGPLGVLGNTTRGLAESMLSVSRFAVSLVDLGVLTRLLWPGRGNWGGTFGLPLVWALVVIGLHWTRDGAARIALAIGATYWILAAAAYPDADIAHRYAIAPAIMLVSVAITVARRHDAPLWVWRAAGVVLLLSLAQILRSAWLYLIRM